MAAKCDTDPSKSWWEIVDGIYTPDFLKRLAAEFDFDVDKTHAASWIKKAGAHYIRGRRWEDQSKPREKLEECVRIEDHARKLEVLLREFEGGDALFMELDSLAQELGEPVPYFPKGGGPVSLEEIGAYQNELYRMLGLVQELMRRKRAEFSPDKGGRPTNRGIGEFTGYIADFWEWQVKRRYTVDYHSGADLFPRI